MDATMRRVALVVGLIALTAPLALADAVRACTVDFSNRHALVYPGANMDLGTEPVTWPLEIGNVRIKDLWLPDEARRGGWGLWFPWRGSTEQSMMNLDSDWAGERGIAIICEAVDPHQPIGLRIAVHCDDLSAHYGNLSLEIGPDAHHLRPVPQGRRFGNGPHYWYLQTSTPEIYRRDTDRHQFAIVLRAEGRAAFLIRQMQLFRYRVG